MTPRDLDRIEATFAAIFARLDALEADARAVGACREGEA